MALSLYRKYRPQTFLDVIGQEHIETTLKNAVLANTVSHAYLFCGPRGTGKTTTARLLAKALLCELAPNAQPDGTCQACRDIASGVHPDVYELDAASRTGVENVREEIIGRVQFAPTAGKYKLYIIDEVHMLSTAAFNALLKVIEEPPSHVVFVLCTTDAHKVPDTIKSRCQFFEFHRLSEEQISSRLQHICDQESYTAAPEALTLIAQRSQGGMRDAISSLEQIAVFTSGNINLEAAISLLGEISSEQLFSIAEVIAKRDVAGCFAWVASFSQGGTDIAQFTRDLALHIRNLYIAAAGSNNSVLVEVLNADEELCSRYKAQANNFGSMDRLADILAILGDLAFQLRNTANARLALEIALTRMARPGGSLTLESLAARIDALEAALAAGGAVGSGSAVAGSAVGTGGVFGIDGAVDTGVIDDAGHNANTEKALEARSGVKTEALGASETYGETRASNQNATGHAVEHAVEYATGNVTEHSLEHAGKNTTGHTGNSTVEHPAEHATTPTSELGQHNAHRLWTQVIKQLQANKKVGLATLLGGSAGVFDATSGGLIVELPQKATFAKQNLERKENLDLVNEALGKVHGKKLKISYRLSDVLEPSVSASAAVSTAANAVNIGVPAVSNSTNGIFEQQGLVDIADTPQTNTLIDAQAGVAVSSQADAQASSQGGAREQANNQANTDVPANSQVGAQTDFDQASLSEVEMQDMLAMSFGGDITFEEVK